MNGPVLLFKGGENTEGGGETRDVRVLLREWSAEHLPDRHKSLHRSKQSTLDLPQISWILLSDADASVIACMSCPTFSYLQRETALLR